MALFDLVKNIVPKGTFFGDILGSTRSKGSGFLGVHIGPKEYQNQMSPVPAVATQTTNGQNVYITGLLILLAGFLLFTFIRK